MCPIEYFSMVRSKDHVFDLRVHLVRYALEHGLRAAAEAFQCTRNTVRKWTRRYGAEGLAGLAERSRAPKHCPHKTPPQLEAQVLAQRLATPGFSARRMKHEFELAPSIGAIGRILREQGLTRRPRRKHQKKRDLRALKARLKAFRHFQMDVKYLDDIPHYWTPMKLFGLPTYQYSIREVRTGAAFVSYAPELSLSHAEACARRFLRHLERFGVPLCEVVIQTDPGSEFDGQALQKHTSGFTHTIEKLYGSTHRLLKPHRPNHNADVESFHARIEAEFFDIEAFANSAEFWTKITTYQHYFNLTRKNSYKNWKSPRTLLHEADPHLDPRLLLLPPVDLDMLLAPGVLPARAAPQVGHHVPAHTATKDFVERRRFCGAAVYSSPRLICL